MTKITPKLTANLRALERAYCAATNSKPSTFWQKAVGNWQFLERVDAGGGFTTTSYDRAIRWCAENWPDGAEWPEGIVRPELTDATP